MLCVGAASGVLWILDLVPYLCADFTMCLKAGVKPLSCSCFDPSVNYFDTSWDRKSFVKDRFI